MATACLTIIETGGREIAVLLKDLGRQIKGKMRKAFIISKIWRMINVLNFIFGLKCEVAQDEKLLICQAYLSAKDSCRKCSF